VLVRISGRGVNAERAGRPTNEPRRSTSSDAANLTDGEIPWFLP
jgi:hypothetical protein